MIDGMDGIEAYLRDVPRRPEAQVVISATGWDARTPRSVEAHGHAQHDDHGHTTGTRVTLRYIVGSSLVNSTSSSSGVLVSDAASSALGGDTITVYMPMTETGTYVSDQIVDDMKFATGLMHTTWVPPTVRLRTRLR
jgi:hypothetical protein